MGFLTQPYECVHVCFIESFIQLIQKHLIMQEGKSIFILLNGSAVFCFFVVFCCFFGGKKIRKLPSIFVYWTL